jgi:hypothetical protein
LKADWPVAQTGEVGTMSTPIRSRGDRPDLDAAPESAASAVSWPAVIAGASVTGAVSFVLMALGAGMGLSSVSPWPSGGAWASRVGPGAIVWIVIVQLLSCALGGYLAGRLRTRWVAVHTHEVFFRDTAHGLLVWAVSLVVGAVLVSSLGASLAKSAAAAADDDRAGTGSYFADSLFRSGHPMSDASDSRVRAEARAILARTLTERDMDPEDKSYLASLVAARTGLGQAEAERRVDQTTVAAREAADRARKAVAHSLYWLVVAFLVGAFSGSWFAVVGGRLRDRVPAV